MKLIIKVIEKNPTIVLTFAFEMSITKQHTVWLSLGSNLGDRSLNLKNARDAIRLAGNRIISVSGIYESSPWGYNSEHSFYNQCIEVRSSLDPLNVLLLIKDIERTAGRERVEGSYSDRTLDIDILFYDDLVMDTGDLSIPHPLMKDRYFVLYPLNEIAAEKKHPVWHKTVSEFLETCPDEGTIRRLPDK
ncbi:2-amino-4-hydroxy-6-hydroxymethyldihydropteridine diphosphokinase [Bacteroidota bacterium]